jgi:hypothetical protein
MIISKGRLKDFLEDKGIVEGRAIEIAKRIAELNPKEKFLADIVGIKFWDDSVTVKTSGYARGYYEEDIDFPISYLSEANWEEQYNALLEKQKSNEELRNQQNLLAQRNADIQKLKELQAKYPNL